MSILRKEYTISVWEDHWDPELGFVEKRLGVIGSDTMTSQGRAQEPNLLQNVNGVKKLSFKMYKHYRDNITGEEVQNPFIDWLINERRVRLDYKGKRYDFVIKNVSENSSNYLYTYSLEDAWVNELSKNGYGVVLDTKLENNIGTAQTLAQRVLEGTDWLVESEKFVEKIAEPLVYLKTKREILASEKIVKKLTDQTNYSKGIVAGNFGENIPEGTVILGFYSSCTNKPYRFQFIYKPMTDAVPHNLKDGKQPLSRNDERIINEANCQYYIDYPSDIGLDLTYSTCEKVGYEHLSAPADFEFFDPQEFKTEYDPTVDTLVSNWYRGNRYNFSQGQVYCKLLDRYVNMYGSKGTVYGYKTAEFNSPVLTTNLASNPGMESLSGWRGVKTSTSTSQKKATIETAYGYFDEEKKCFVDATQDLENGNFDTANGYAPYLKFSCPTSTSAVFNSGLYDNRVVIKNMERGSEWGVRYLCYDKEGDRVNNLTLTLDGYTYNPTNDSYAQDSKFSASQKEEEGENGITYTVFTVSANSYTDKDFRKNAKIYLNIKSATAGTDEFYLKELVIFKIHRKDGKIIPPLDDTTTVDGTVNYTYKYFNASALYVTDENGNTVDLLDADKLVYLKSSSVPLNNSYKPYFTPEAEKVRAISAKESNYFNILQTIAEKFQCWLELEVSSNEDGTLTKKVKLKNYIGKKNYAGFKYGVNLVDINRVYESKNLVTKLIVKNNSNEHAENGFCTIARAGSNETGENFIYDFQYYYKKGLLNPEEDTQLLYSGVGAEGEDINAEALAWNLNNYYARLKNINSALLTPANERLANLSLELTKLEAEKEVADNTIEAATTLLQETRESFYDYTGVSLDNYMGGSQKISTITLSGNKKTDETRAEGGLMWISDLISSIQVTGSGNSFTFSVALTKAAPDNTTIYIDAFPKFTFIDGETLTKKFTLPCEIAAGNTTATIEYDFYPVDKDSTKVKQLITEFIEQQIALQNSQAALDGTESAIGLTSAITQKQAEKNTILADINKYTGWKKTLNSLFYQRYSRYIQEGTWISEEYIDDEKYYNDSLSVLYNSCLPQVAYSINVMSLTGIPEYKDYDYEIGDETYVVDPKFFGTNLKESVIISESNECLDDPSKNTIKVQNFKNQFQDLFQKITATVQQAQYSTGAYEKAANFLQSSAEQRFDFLEGALNDAATELSVAGQQTVVSDNSGITIYQNKNRSNALRLVSGAILFSSDDNGQQKWKTGITSKGISADLVTAGQVNTGVIQIMNGNEAAFRWDAKGISAYDSGTYGIDQNKFVRLDKYGLYGINGSQNGETYSPQNAQEIDRDANFALTWEGLKVTGDNGGTARIGKQDGRILQVQDKNGQETFSVSNEGKIKTTGIEIISGTINGENLASTNYVDGKDVAVRSDLGSAIEAQAAATLAEAEGFASGLASGLQSQIDGEITTWFEEGTPISMGEGSSIVVNSNPPSKNWTTQEEKIKHEGDLYYDTNTQYCFRWVRKGTSPNFTWTWEQIADEGIVEALAAASRAQDTADGKRTIFSTQPTPPYQVNDLWAVSVDTKYPDNSGRSYKGELLQCKTAKNKGESFAFSDWRVATKYTDNTELDNFKVNYNTTLQSINNQLDAKAETHYGPTDPAIYSGSNAWGANRVGDLWHCTAEIKNGGTVIRGENTEWIWQGTTSNGTTTYAWHEMAVADEVFDIIDGKSNIFTTVPGSEIQVNEGDILIPVSDIKSGGKVLYYAGKVYRYVGSTWKEVNYTDTDSARNYVLLSKEAKTSNQYKVAQYNLAEDWIKGETYSISIKGTVNDDQKFGIWANGSSTRVAVLNYDSDLGLHTAVFAPGDITTQTAKTLHVYNYPSDTATSSSIEWIALTKNNKPVTTWTAAPEDVLDIRDSLQSQIDKKADIYYQATDPSSNKNWGDDQVGNLWRKTTTNEEFVWIKKSDNTYGWHEMEVPNAVFDAYDGKSSMYVTKPSSYKRNDVWILDKEGLDTSSSDYDATYPPYKLHSWVICVKNTTEKITTYNRSDWEEITRYTDNTELNAFISGDFKSYQDTVKTQFDQKSEIYYQATDPAESHYSGDEIWEEEHKGDLWRCTATTAFQVPTSTKKATKQTINKNGEYVWTGNATDGYGWHEMEIPDKIFDAYDGKKTIYTSKPTSYEQNDLWILDAATQKTTSCPTYKNDSNEEVKYAVGTILVSTVTANTYSKSNWTEKVKYIDSDKATSIANDRADAAIKALNLPTSTSILTTDMQISSSINNGITTITVKDKNNGSLVSSTTVGENYIATDVGLGSGSIGPNGDKKFLVDASGTLMADNAIIHGTIFANEGYMGGWHIAQTVTGTTTKTYSGSLTYGDLGTDKSFHMYANDFGVIGKIGNKDISGTLSDTNPGWKLAVGSKFGVDANGNLYASGGNIAGWTVDSTGLQKGNLKFVNSNTDTLNSMITNNSTSPVCLQAGSTIGISSERYKVYSSSFKSGDNPNNYTYTVDLSDKVSGIITSCVAKSVRFSIPGWRSTELPTSSYTFTFNSSNKTITFTAPGSYNGGSLYVEYACYYKESSLTTTPTFRVLQDGTLYCAGLKSLKGEISAFKYDEFGFKSGEPGDALSFIACPDGVSLSDSAMKYFFFEDEADDSEVVFNVGKGIIVKRKADSAERQWAVGLAGGWKATDSALIAKPVEENVWGEMYTTKGVSLSGTGITYTFNFRDESDGQSYTETGYGDWRSLVSNPMLNYSCALGITEVAENGTGNWIRGTITVNELSEVKGMILTPDVGGDAGNCLISGGVVGINGNVVTVSYDKPNIAAKIYKLYWLAWGPKKLTRT